MPEFTSHPPGTPNWVDLMTPDVDAAKAFYTTVFGWDGEDQLDDEGNRIYVMFSLGGKSVAGLGGQRRCRHQQGGEQGDQRLSELCGCILHPGFLKSLSARKGTESIIC